MARREGSPLADLANHPAAGRCPRAAAVLPQHPCRGTDRSRTPFRSVRPGTAGTVRRRATGVTGSGTGPRRAGADQCAGLLVSGISPRLPELAARHPKLQFDLTLTDDFIDPIAMRRISFSHQQPAGRGLSRQSVWQPALLPDRLPEYVSRYGSRLRRRHCINIARWSMAVRRSQPLAVSPARRGMGALSVDPAHDLEQCRCPAHFSHRRDGIVLFPDWMVSEALHNGH